MNQDSLNPAVYTDVKITLCMRQ